MFKQIGDEEDRGHQYVLKHTIGSGHESLFFINKRKQGDDDELTVIHDGTTTGSVIEMLIDRIDCLDAICPCTENGVAAAHLRVALRALESRTADREKRGVEGTAKA